MKRTSWLAAAGAFALAALTVQARAAEPTRQEAAAFIKAAEAELSGLSDEAARADWLRQTNINTDTNFLAARLNARLTERGSALAKQAAAYDARGLDPVVARTLELLKRGLTLPAPARAGAAQSICAHASLLWDRHCIRCRHGGCRSTGLSSATLLYF